MRQLDDISQSIGRLTGMLEALDRYTHEREHGVNNLSQKVDGLSTQLSGEITKAKAELDAAFSASLERVNARIQTIDDRVNILEKGRVKDETTRNFFVWFIQSPLVGWLAAAALVISTWWKDQIR